MSPRQGSVLRSRARAVPPPRCPARLICAPASVRRARAPVYITRRPSAGENRGGASDARRQRDKAPEKGTKWRRGGRRPRARRTRSCKKKKSEGTEGSKFFIGKNSIRESEARARAQSDVCYWSSSSKTEKRDPTPARRLRSFTCVHVCPAAH